MFKRLTAEFIGTLWLVLGGCGSAVLAAAFPNVGIGLLGACDGGLGLGCIGARTLRDERRFKHRDIVGQGCRIGLHKTDRITNRAGFVLLSRAKPQFDLTRGRRPPSQLWIAPVDRFQEITHLRGCQREDAVHRLWPCEAAAIEALRIKR